MANVLHRISKQYLKSVNTPDFPVKDWIINPVLPGCSRSDWVVEGDIIRETTQIEKDAIEAMRFAKQVADEEKRRLAQEAAETQASQERNAFMALSVEDKLMYLFDLA